MNKIEHACLWMLSTIPGRIILFALIVGALWTAKLMTVA